MIKLFLEKQLLGVGVWNVYTVVNYSKKNVMSIPCWTTIKKKQNNTHASGENESKYFHYKILFAQTKSTAWT